jgi:hypothetical protein
MQRPIRNAITVPIQKRLGLAVRGVSLFKLCSAALRGSRLPDMVASYIDPQHQPANRSIALLQDQKLEGVSCLVDLRLKLWRFLRGHIPFEVVDMAIGPEHGVRVLLDAAAVAEV